MHTLTIRIKSENEAIFKSYARKMGFEWSIRRMRERPVTIFHVECNAADMDKIEAIEAKLN